MVYTAGVPNLQDLMPDDLRWSWCNNTKYNVHNKFNALESSPNHSISRLVCGKTIFYEMSAKNFGDCWSREEKKYQESDNS